ncbi:uncharacterized protein [Physcomitrium patens]|uniref:uncharacterized protein isoform X1 n=1 Tax=Physcomitrium patens TaxID=3218 RepID=UPI003CCD1ED3
MQKCIEREVGDWGAMTVATRSPRVHRGSALPPGVPPPKKGELHMRVEGFEWQNSEFEARPPVCCGLLISWWGEANHNSLLMPLSGAFSCSPATAVYSVHSTAKHFEMYLHDMGYLELTVVNGNTSVELIDDSHSTLGKLSVSVSSLAEGHPVRGFYPIFADGHQLIGSITLSITVTFYNCVTDGGAKSLHESIGHGTYTTFEKGNPHRMANHSVLAVERNGELVPANKSLRVCPPPFLGTLREPMQRDVSLNPYSPSNSERSAASPVLDREFKFEQHPIELSESFTIEDAVQKLMIKRLPRSKPNLSSESGITPPASRGDGSTPHQRKIAHCSADNPYLNPSFCELDELEGEMAYSLCGSDDSSLSCVISKSARLIKSLAGESSVQDGVDSINLPWTETAFKDLSLNGSHKIMLDKVHDLLFEPGKPPCKAGKVDGYSLVHEKNAEGNKVKHTVHEKQLSILDSTETVRRLIDITSDSAVNAVEEYLKCTPKSDVGTTESIRSLMHSSKDSLDDAIEGNKEHRPRSGIRVPQPPEFCADESNRGGLSELLVSSLSTVPRSTYHITENSVFTPNINVWRVRDEKLVRQEVKARTSVQRRSSIATTLSPGTRPLIPEVNFGFDPGGKQQSLISSIPTVNPKRDNHLTTELSSCPADLQEFCNSKGKSGSSSQHRSSEPHTGFEMDQSGKKQPPRPCPSPQSVIDDINQLIMKAEACRDTLKQSNLFKAQSMPPPIIPFAGNSRPSMPLDGHQCDFYSGAYALLDRILADDNKRDDGDEHKTKVLIDEDLDTDDEPDHASDVMKRALLEALYLDNDNAFNDSSNVAMEHSLSETSLDEIQLKVEVGRRKNYWYDECMKSRDSGLKNIKHRHDVTMNASKYDDMLSYCSIPAQPVNFPWSKQCQPFTLHVAIGKLVLCGPMVRDLADSRPSKISFRTIDSVTQSMCTCSLTISFPTFIPPYSSKQRISISPVLLGTREAVFDHQSQLSWRLLPGLNLKDWQSRNLHVTVLFTWQHLDNLECEGTLSLEKVVAAMPGIFRTSLALTIITRQGLKRSKSGNPSRRQCSSKVGEKQKVEPRPKLSLGLKKKFLENHERSTSLQKDVAARVEVMLHLTHDYPISANKRAHSEDTDEPRMERPLSSPRMKPSPSRVIRNSDPMEGNIQGNPQDWWLHVTLHDIVNCFQNILTSEQLSSKKKLRAPHLVLVFKSSPELMVQAPFPMKLNLHNRSPGKTTNTVLRAPVQLLNNRKAIMFIEVWHDAGVNNGSHDLGLLAGLIEVPLTMVPGIASPTNDLHRIAAKGGEVVGEGLHQLFDPLKCAKLGSVMVVVTLGLSYQMHRLRKAHRAATVIQRSFREFLTRRLRPHKSIEITRFWEAGNQRIEIN